MITQFAPIFWWNFICTVPIVLLIDLLIFSRGGVSFPYTMKTTLCWVLCMVFFGVMLYVLFPHDSYALDFFTGYFLELSLSVDNLFVFIMIFKFFRIEGNASQHKILFWGIFGALVFRFIMITTGIYFVQNFVFVFYVFGAILIFSAIKVILRKIKGDNDEKVQFGDSYIIRLLSYIIPLDVKTETNEFFIKSSGTESNNKVIAPSHGKVVATRLFLALILIEQADIAFAVDSIAAILAITQEPFIIFSSNVFAILGLRSMYFILSNLMKKFQYLDYGVSAILLFIGGKLVFSASGIHISTTLSLAFIFISITVSVMLSIIFQKRYVKR